MNAPLAPSRDNARNGRGWADHDLPFEFGHLPRVAAPAPFTLHQYARLLVLRSRLSDQALHRRHCADPAPEPTPPSDTNADSTTEPLAPDSRAAATIYFAVLIVALIAFAVLLMARGMITL
jgi:hypothetical protein